MVIRRKPGSIAFFSLGVPVSKTIPPFIIVFATAARTMAFAAIKVSIPPTSWLNLAIEKAMASTSANPERKLDT